MHFDKYTLSLFWNIGKSVYEDENKCENAVKKYADYYSYYYGDSIIFTRENIHIMKRFYMNFPIFHKKLEMISWDQYQLLLRINNKMERSFYFYISLLFHNNYEETLELINNQYFCRI